MDAPRPQYADLKAKVLTFPTPLLPPGYSHDPALTAIIADASLHPALEALLHIQNHDLPSAHFLVRHMQAEPAHEGMYIHGLLHRIEGDYDNCRAWYGDVCMQDVFVNFWGEGDADVPAVLRLDKHEAERLGGEVIEDKEESGGGKNGPRLVKLKDGDTKAPSQLGARAFVSAIQELRFGKEDCGLGKNALEEVSRAEIDALVKWCEGKFGTEPVLDATKVWVRHDEEIRQKAEEMTSTGEGHRKF